MKPRFSAESYINEIGQRINPGDSVIVVTKSTGRIEVHKGIFEGVNWQSRYSDNSVPYISSARVSGVPGYRYVKTGEFEEAIDYWTKKTYQRPVWKKEDCFRIVNSKCFRIYKTVD